MGWVTEKLKSILLKHGTQFFSKRGSDREEYLDEIIELLKATNEDLPESGTRNRSSRSSAREMYSECYEEIKREMAEEGTMWNEIHRKVMAKLWEELTEDEQTECRDTAVARNSGDVGEEEKRKLSSANASDEINAFVKKIHEIYGVRMVCLSSFTDSKGKAQVSVPKFSQQFPKWKTAKNVATSFLEYSEMFEDETVEVMRTRRPRNQNTPGRSWAIMMMRMMNRGMGILSFRNDLAPENLKQGARALVSSKYLPEGLGLMDPSRMKKSDVEAYYTFWMGRQKEEKKPLTFKYAEVKEKLAEDRQVRLDALKSKKRQYEEVDEMSDDVGAGSKASATKKKRGPSGSGKSKAGDKAEDGKSEGIGGSTSGKGPAAVRPQPALKPKAREAVLLRAVLKLATVGPRSQKNIANPPGCRGISYRKDGDDFFDANNDSGYLANWKAVLRWMGEHPHIPDSPLTHDLAKIQEVVRQMLGAVPSKKSLKFGVSAAIHRAIDSTWKKTCLKVGLSEDDVKMFSPKWQEFVEAYAGADGALIRSSKPARLLAADDFPEPVKTWSGAAEATTGDYPASDETDWEASMGDVWTRVQADATARSMQTMWMPFSTRIGLGVGAAAFIQMSKDEGSQKNWVEALRAINDVFKLISELPSLLSLNTTVQEKTRITQGVDYMSETTRLKPAAPGAQTLKTWRG
ncbi:hypothetical protein B0H10DRAFT_2199808 [Mycena sp. CBHHK59/15]|nr:hypothetical protein B0H10DRAFT_2199808 [Mycena sp. CBHHK59/15]